MKILFLLSFIFFSAGCHFLQAQNSLSGKVVDRNNKEALIGASVYITELKKGAVATADGNYKLSGLPAGIFTVEVRCLSYQPFFKKITIKGDIKEDFILEVSAMQMKEVIVT